MTFVFTASQITELEDLLNEATDQENLLLSQGQNPQGTIRVSTIT